jgi:hypothetical protein
MNVFFIKTMITHMNVFFIKTDNTHERVLHKDYDTASKPFTDFIRRVIAQRRIYHSGKSIYYVL